MSRNKLQSSEEPKGNSLQQQDKNASRSNVAVAPEENNAIDTADTTTPEEPKTQSSSRRKRKWLIAGGAIALLISSFFGWRWWQTSSTQEPPPGQNQPQAVQVKIATIKPSTVVENTEFIAELESRQAVTLLPQIQGRVSEIYVTPGNRVEAGTPLIQINPEEQQAAVSGTQAAASAARAQVANARATLSSLEAERLASQSQLRLSQRQYKRYSTLAAQGAVSREIRDQYFDQLQAARSSLAAINKRIEAQQATLEQAQEALQQAQAEIKQAKVQLNYYTVNAPFTGTVGAIPVKEGDLVTTSTQLTTVTQNQPLEVNIYIPREQAYRVEVGSTVELLDEQGQKIGDSRVFFISPQVADDTQSVLIKALFENSPTQLRADAFVRARVIWERRPGVLIPITAVSRIAGQTFVYVVQQQSTKSESGKTQLIARQKLIELGNIQGNSYQVVEGLKPGDSIVTSGLLKLSNGTVITPAS